MYTESGITYQGLTPLSPGTNAVFRSGDTVIKIFAPVEAAMSDRDDYSVELMALEEAAKRGVPVPAVLRSGTFRDRYPFNYIIMPFIHGQELGGILQQQDVEEQDAILDQIRSMLVRLHEIPPFPGDTFAKVFQRALHNDRWLLFNPQVRSEVSTTLLRYFNQIDLQTLVFVHGDLTGENLLLVSENRIRLIDFADACIAPPGYDDVALVLGAFDLDSRLVWRYYRFGDPVLFVDSLFPHILLHDFGGGYLRDLAAKLLNLDPGEVSSLAQIREALIRQISIQ
ncbi:MAG: aminoglycoside phosphotransferase family protein [Symbiobacteriaceae bacterium]|nr:aminoglycoside phosphotransferase family protein [Symbiobacteriaceae bacterium]